MGLNGDPPLPVLCTTLVRWDTCKKERDRDVEGVKIKMKRAFECVVSEDQGIPPNFHSPSKLGR